MSIVSVAHTPVPELLWADIPEDMLNPKEVEEAILKEEKRRKWTGSQLYRETLEYGKAFTELEEGEGEVKDVALPEVIEKLRTRLFVLFQDKLGLEKATDLDNTIVTIYNKGDGIKPHIDRTKQPAPDGKKRKYYFGECILGYIVRPDTAASLYFIKPGDEPSPYNLEEKAGRAFLFRGLFRTSWMHGIPPVQDKRISITFRQVLWI